MFDCKCLTHCPRRMRGVSVLLVSIDTAAGLSPHSARSLAVPMEIILSNGDGAHG